MTYPGDPKRLRRAPGAEHPVKVRKLGVNPNRLQHLSAAGVAAVLVAVAGRAYQRTLVEHRPEQVSPPGAALEERLR